jgi:hypothetical protein
VCDDEDTTIKILEQAKSATQRELEYAVNAYAYCFPERVVHHQSQEETEEKLQRLGVTEEEFSAVKKTYPPSSNVSQERDLSTYKKEWAVYA